MTNLIAEARNKNIRTSLAILKPLRVIDFLWREVDREWDKKKLMAVRSYRNNLFSQETDKLFQVVRKLPYEFSYKFITEDDKERKLMIEDLELGQLYWNCLESADGDEKIACQKVKQKYFNEFVNKKDLYFFLGTTKKFHNLGLNPFIIIGTFYPPKVESKQPNLFESAPYGL